MFLLSTTKNNLISLFAQGEDGSWNDNYGFIPSGDTEAMRDADGLEFLCVR